MIDKAREPVSRTSKSRSILLPMIQETRTLKGTYIYINRPRSNKLLIKIKRINHVLIDS